MDLQQHRELFRLDRTKLLTLAHDLAADFARAEPFPHIVIPDFLPLDVAQALAAEFPPVPAPGWVFAGPGESKNSGDVNIEKVQNDREEYFPPLVRHVMHEFNSGTFLDFLMTLTGHSGLLSDPWFGGCGLHSTGNGGRLMIHADQDRHPNNKLHQIFNAIYYVTPGWEDAWGGHLELWDRDLTGCVKKIPPAYNSLVIFFTGAKSFHGHPHPLTTPPGVRRNSMAAYYYTTDRELDETYDGRISLVRWQRTNEHDRPGLRNTVIAAATRLIGESAVSKILRMRTIMLE